MTAVDQTIEGYGGDCWRACIASLIEVSIETVPHFMAEAEAAGGRFQHALAATRAWLRERGYELRGARADAVGVSIDEQLVHLGNLTYCQPGFPRVRERYAIFGVESTTRTPSGDPCLHAVIGYVSLFPWSEGWVAHDPSRQLRGKIYNRVVDAFVLVPAA